MTQSEATAAKILEVLGYSVQRIPEASHQTPDLLATSGAESILVEVKAIREQDSLLEPVKVGNFSRVREPISESKRLDRTLSHGAKQLRATDAGQTAPLRLLWISSESPVAERLRSLQVFCLLYGVDWFWLKGVGWVLPCLFGTYSWFYSNPEICGVLTFEFGGCGLRVNPFSPDRNRLASSRLQLTLGRFGAVFDPARHSGRSDLLVAPFDPPLGSPSAVAQWLEKEHATPVIHNPVAASASGRGDEQMGGYSPVPGEERLVSVLDLKVQLGSR